MPVLEPIDISQDERNSLSQIAEAQRNILFPRNDYNIANEYSAVNPDALATGDDQGKGTGGDLDVFNQAAGAGFDVRERNIEVAINHYNSNTTYPDF
jgi:hypothetical protein